MEDIGITSLSEVRRREDVDLDDNEGEKRQKLEEKQVITTTPKLGDNTNNSNNINGGLLDNLLAKLSSPKPASTPVDLGDFEDISGSTAGGGGGGDDVHVQGSITEERGGGGGGGVGVINNIISSIFHRGGEGDDNVNGHGEKKESKVEVVNKDVVGEVSDEGKTVNGGTIISNLVPDDVVPESDEASILIHSVVHD